MSASDQTISAAPSAAAQPTVDGVWRKILFVLSPAEKRQLWLLLPAMIVMAVLSTVGVASIVPFLGLLSDPDAIERSELLHYLYETLEFEQRESFFFFVGVLVLVILTLSNGFSAATTWALLRFSWMRNHTLSVRLLHVYLRRPYAFFLQRNTSQLAQKLLSEVQTAITGVVVQALNLVARALVIVGIIVALLLIDPAMAVGLGLTFGGTYGGLFFMARKRMSQIGERRVTSNRSRYKIADELFASIKELKLAGLESRYLEHFATSSLTFSEANASARIIAQLPRYALESISFGSVLLMILFMLYRGNDLTGVLPILGLYAFASYRLLPALQQVFSGMALVRANLASLDDIIVDLPRFESLPLSSPRAERMAFEVAVELEGVSYRYDGAERDALDEITLAIRRGEWVALVGPTGSGKSTLVDVLLGLLEPTGGVMQVDDEVVTASRLGAWQQCAGYVPQQIFLADDSVRSNIAFGEDDDDVDDEWLTTVAGVAQIGEFIESELPEGWETVVGERGVRLSGGQRQRLGIARALYRRPDLLVLDEATSALDNDTEARFFERLRASLSDVSVVSIAHRLTTTRGFDRIYVIEAGQIVDEGTFSELCARNPHFKHMPDDPSVITAED